MCGDVEEGGGDEAGDLPLGGVISAHLHRVARQQRPAALTYPRLAPADIHVDILEETLVDILVRYNIQVDTLNTPIDIHVDIHEDKGVDILVVIPVDILVM